MTAAGTNASAPPVAMSTMTELGEHLSLGERNPAGLDAATALAVPGLPWPLPSGSQAAAVG